MRIHKPVRWPQSRLGSQRGSTLTGYSLLVVAFTVVSLGAVAALDRSSNEFLTNTGDSIGDPRAKTADLAATATATGPAGPSGPSGPTGPTTPGGEASAFTYTSTIEGNMARTGSDSPIFCLQGGSPLTQEACDAAEGDQVFQAYARTTDGHVKLVFGGNCASVNSSTADGASVITETCTDSDPSQFWEYLPATGQYVNSETGQCLDVAGASSTAGGNLIQWPCHSGDNQVFDAPTV